MYKDKDKQREANEGIYKPEEGCIYIIHCIGFPYYKVGRSTQPQLRLDTLQIGTPFELKLDFAVVVKDMVEVEYKIQQRIKDKHHRGEWYVFTEGMLEAVKEEIIALRNCVHTGKSYPAYLRQHPRIAKQCGFTDE